MFKETTVAVQLQVANSKRLEHHKIDFSLETKCLTTLAVVFKGKKGLVHFMLMDCFMTLSHFASISLNFQKTLYCNVFI